MSKDQVHPGQASLLRPAWFEIDLDDVAAWEQAADGGTLDAFAKIDVGLFRGGAMPRAVFVDHGPDRKVPFFETGTTDAAVSITKRAPSRARRASSSR